MMALTTFAADRVPELQKQNPGLAKQDLSILLLKEFEELEDGKKEALRHNDTGVSDDKSNDEDVVEPTENVKLFKGEPAPPPQNAFLSFTKEFMRKNTYIPSKERMKRSNMEWKKLSKQQKDALSKKHQAAKEKYLNNFRVFIESQTAEQLAEYYAFKGIDVPKVKSPNEEKTTSSEDDESDSSSSSSNPEENDEDSDSD